MPILQGSPIHRSAAVWIRTVLIFFLAVSLTACSPRITTPTPDRELEPPDPFPDRLLVQIAPSEIAPSFRPQPTSCNLAQLSDAGILPVDLEVAQIGYQGLSRESNPVFSIQLREAHTLREIETALSGSTARRFEVIIAEPDRGLAEGVSVEVGREDLVEGLLDLCQPNYYHLQQNSSLHSLFRSIGVASMRRVFRSLERPDVSTPGNFTVESFRDRLQQAKINNPQRTSRAYQTFPGSDEEIIIDDNMENWFILRLDGETSVENALNTLQNSPGVQHVEFDYPIAFSQPNDPEWPDQWAMNNTGTFQGAPGGLVGFDINIEEAWAAAPQQQTLVVAVIDTGINDQLNELSGRMWTNPGEGSLPNGMDDDCNGYVDDIHGITTFDRFAVVYDYTASGACSSSPGGPPQIFSDHGTSVAGIIAAQANNNWGIAGTVGADDIELMNLALGSYSSEDWRFPSGQAEVAEALFYAINPTFTSLGTEGTVRGADIVNMSFTFLPCSSLFFEALYAALDSGTIVVASAGNDAVRFDKTPERNVGVYPASLPGVIAVGGASRDGTLWVQSNYGPGIDLVAPAADVQSISYDPNNPQQTLADVATTAGTSSSAAFVSGGAAVVLARYPSMTAPLMRQLLRGLATDITDPLGDSSDHVGDDEWTGAGLLNVGAATTALADPNNQPIVVEVLVEKARSYVPYLMEYRQFATGGQPDLGIRVEGSALNEWTLSYGLGDAPQTWTNIPIDPSIRTQEFPEFQLVNGRHGGDLPAGNNFLDTDPLTNNQIYTLRLQAENFAGTTFTAYDWFVPTRADIVFPEDNWTMVPAWGWMPAGGYIDDRDTSTYQVRVYNSANQLLWQSSPVSQRFDGYNPDGWPVTDVGRYTLFGTYGFWAPYQFPALDTVFSAEGWHEYRLAVQSGAGIDQDVARFYVDMSHFSAAYWGIQHESVTLNGRDLANERILNHESTTDNLIVSDPGPSGAPHLFLKVAKFVMALDENGSLLWEKRPLRGPNYHFHFSFSYDMVLNDVDNDGQPELVYAVNEDLGDGSYGLRVLLLNARDGSPYNANWPKTIEFERQKRGADLAVGDLTGDANKEIVVLQPSNFYFGIPAEDLQPAAVRVLGVNGAELWSYEFPPDVTPNGPIEISDIDNDGKGEVLITKTAQILDGDGSFLSGWDAPKPTISAAFVQKGNGRFDVLLWDRNGLTLKSLLGADYPGWPISERAQFWIGQVIAGGDEEIILCDRSIRVYDTTGSRTTTPEITLTNSGQCGGLTLLDIDGDSQDEFIVLVNNYPENPAATERVGSFVEAYEFTGVRLADSDNRWPIVAPFQDYPRHPRGPEFGRQIAFGDVDGDGLLEVVQQMPIGPYHLELNHVVPSWQVEVLQLP